MKFKAILLALALTIPLGTVGCKPATSTTPATAVAPGYTSPADQTMGEILAAAHGFYARIQADIAAGTYTPAPAEKTTLNNFASALNSAQIAYLAFHNGVGSQAAAQAAVNQVQTQQTALQAQIGQK